MDCVADAPSLRFCTHATNAGLREFWEGSRPLPVGLRVEIRSSDRGVSLAVFSGGPVAKMYMLAGTHAPLQVDGRFDVVDGEPRQRSLSAQFVYGTGDRNVPAELLDRVAVDAVELVRAVVLTAASFPSRWDRAVAAHLESLSVKGAARAARRSARVLEAAAETLAREVAAISDGPTLSAAELRRDERLAELVAELVAPSVWSGSLPSGDELTARTTAAVLAEARRRLGAAERLSATEFVELATDHASMLTGTPRGELLPVVTAVYDLFHDVFYGTDGFPDRAPSEAR